jgi:hypothetical protein
MNNNSLNIQSLPIKKKKKKEKEISSDIKINFKYDDYEPYTSKYMPGVRKSNGKIYYDNVDILDQNRFKFILNMENVFIEEKSEKEDKNMKTRNNNYLKYSYQINSNLKWEDIAAVIYYSVDIYTCPICLEKKMICPKITRCGHIFCWPCLYNYYDYWTKSSINKKVPKCPLCQEKINLHQIKFCDVLHCVNYTDSSTINIQQTNGYITFNLIMKNKKAPTLYNTYYDPDLSYYKNHLYDKDGFNFIPLENQEEFSFSRLFLTNPQLMLKRYNNIKSILEEALKEELTGYSDERRIYSINKCIDIINAKINSLKDTNVDLKSDDEYEEEIEDNNENNDNNENESNEIDNNNNPQTLSEHNNDNGSTIDEESKTEKKDIDLKKFVYFYQEQYGDIYYLHPINYSILLAEYSSEEHLPIEISGRILEIEMHQITPFLKNKYPFLNHLRIGSLFFFVEIDMKPIVSNHTTKAFHSILKERAKVRNLIKREEENYDFYVASL